MATPAEVRERFEQLRSEYLTIAAECMLENKEEIVGLLVHQQYEESVDSDGKPLREYSAPYLRHKQLAGKPTRTTLNETGEFQTTMNLRVDPAQNEYEIESPSTVSNGYLKSDILNTWNEKGGGGEVMNLTKENEALIFPIIEESFTEKCKERLLL